MTWARTDPAAAPDAPRLFTFAHAGGGAAFFHPWRPVLGPDINVSPVVLPGSESRQREQPYRRMSHLVPALVDGLAPVTDRPFALFGHSLGAAIAYEAACALSDRGTPPVCLFVSGRGAPHVPRRRPELHRLSDDDFLAVVAMLNGIPDAVMARRELIACFLPAMRADFELNETYLAAPRPALPVPVVAFTADRDPEVGIDEMARWAELTSGRFTQRVFAGDHFYLKGAHPGLLACIQAELAGQAALQRP